MPAAYSLVMMYSVQLKKQMIILCSFHKCTFTESMCSLRTVIAAVAQLQAFASNMRSSLDPPSSPGASLRTAVIARCAAGSAEQV